MSKHAHSIDVLWRKGIPSDYVRIARDTTLAVLIKTGNEESVRVEEHGTKVRSYWDERLREKASPVHVYTRRQLILNSHPIGSKSKRHFLKDERSWWPRVAEYNVRDLERLPIGRRLPALSGVVINLLGHLFGVVVQGVLDETSTVCGNRDCVMMICPTLAHIGDAAARKMEHGHLYCPSCLGSVQKQINIWTGKTSAREAAEEMMNDIRN